MTSQDYKNLGLPDNPGVYYFKKDTDILYIGRATSLKDRVKSYFNDDLISTRGPLLVDMVTKANTVEWKETDSVLEAVILEANEIKKYLPYYNTKEKDNKSFYCIVITDEEFPRILLVRERNLELNYKCVFGPYPNGGVVKNALKIIRKIFPFRDTCKIGKLCFNAQIGLCPGVCGGKISKQEYVKIIKKITLFLEGKKDTLISELEKEMHQYAKDLAFEKAEEIKKTLYALTHVHDMSLIKEDNEIEKEGFRIEAYDVAHLSGKNTAGVMVVAYDDAMEHSAYRKFKIKHEKGAHEAESLKEILSRRFSHPEWPKPNLVVVDGNEIQRNAAQSLTDIPVVSVVKNEKHKPKALLGDPEIIKKYQKIILLANSEAHRFSIAYHRLLRSRMV
ncbi:MAG: UvrB/UvrC motif-containing protein [Candidatus Pacebacteria bacterium]|nr:UvrB/UvrC motif-containing protein [Candidatus Paceibacterota bacterium]